MVKVRFDIIVAAFLIFFLDILGNSFININKGHFESLDKDGYKIGYPAGEETIAVTTLTELAMATEYGYPFAIVADSDNVKKTNYYLQLNGDGTVEKKSRFSIWFNRALGGNYYDRIYIVELADEQRVPVLMLDGVLDMSENIVIFPVGKAKFLSEETDYLNALDKKYDLSESAAKQWYVNASGKDLTIFTHYKEKAESLKTTNRVIIGVTLVLYSVISTILIRKKGKKKIGEAFINA